MLARVKQDYAAGPVTAFSGREYVRQEWREVPPGFEEEAKTHPLLDIQPSLDEIRENSPMLPGLGTPEGEEQGGVTTETPGDAVPDEPESTATADSEATMTETEESAPTPEEQTSVTAETPKAPEAPAVEKPATNKPRSTRASRRAAGASTSASAEE